MAQVLSKDTYTSLHETTQKLPYKKKKENLMKLFPQ